MLQWRHDGRKNVKVINTGLQLDFLMVIYSPILSYIINPGPSYIYLGGASASLSQRL